MLPSAPQISPRLEWDAVNKSFGTEHVIESISLAAASGERLVLIGPSGCGKSTLLRMLVGLVTPDGGSIRFDGEPLTEANLTHERRRIGYVIQEGGLFPHLSCAANLSLMPHQLGWPSDRTNARIAELAELVRLPAELLSRDPHRLSGGQRQRVSLMRSLMLGPDLLLLDEPLGALDPLIRADLQRDLKAIFETLGTTVVMVTHDLSEAAWFADRIALLESGRLAQVGTLEDFLKNPASELVSRFVSASQTLSSSDTAKPITEESA